jgi:hypothetical protein
MTIEEQVLEKLRDLPPEKQKEALDFVDFLNEKNGTKKPRRNLRGLWKDLNIEITERISLRPAVKCGVISRETSPDACRS